MTDFLRNNRYASAILTTVILVVIGVVVGFTRDGGPKSQDFVLRADEQAVQPGTTMSLPSAVAAPLTPATLANRPPITLGRTGRPVRPGDSAAPRSGAGTTVTTRDTTETTRRDDTPAATTTTRPPSTAFGANRVAFSAGGSLWTINPDGSDPKAVANSGFFAAWAPDHRVIAFSDADRPGGGLHLVNAAGERYGLTTGVVKDSEPSWSPDGSKLAFARIDTASTDGYSGIWVINRDGSNLRRVAITPACFNRDPAWSPDGTKIAFWSSGRDHCSGGPDEGSYELYTLTLSTGEVKRLGTATNSGAPAWSPDGKTIAFSSDGYGGEGFEICVMASDGSNVQRITTSAGDDTGPAWSPDGRQIAFRSDREGGGIFVMRANGSAVEMLVAGGTQPSWR